MCACVVVGICHVVVRFAWVIQLSISTPNTFTVPQVNWSTPTSEGRIYSVEITHFKVRFLDMDSKQDFQKHLGRMDDHAHFVGMDYKRCVVSETDEAPKSLPKLRVECFVPVVLSISLPEMVVTKHVNG